jgi:hypothetical protein
MPVDLHNGQGAGHGPGAWAAVFAERQQYIEDTAECTGCGTTLRFCNLLRETNTDRTAPEWLGCCAIGNLPGPCHHVKNQKMVNELLREAAGGVIRTVAEAYLPPVLGPNRPSWTWLLEQDEWWYPLGRPAIRIASMEKPWRWNVARFIERKAARLESADRWRGIWADAPDDVMADLERRTPAEFLREQPLYQAMTRGLPDARGNRGQRLAARAVHWSTCPMRLAHPGKLDRCVCIQNADGRTVGATNDPATGTP